MKLKYHGHACFSMRFDSGARLAVDPFDPTVSFLPCKEACDAVIVSHDHFDHNYISSLPNAAALTVIREAGEYEIGGVHIRTLPCYHDPFLGARRGGNLISILEGDGLRIAHLGDLGHMPEGTLMDALRGIDVMLLPIGGNYTIDTAEAEALIRAAKPRMAIGMHFRTDAYDIDVSTDEAFRRDMMAATLPREICISAETLAALPSAGVMDYK